MSKNQSKKTTYTEDETSWKEAPFLAIKGFLMGSADIVPGVSGGTMALITGVYSRLISAIRSFDGQAVKTLARFNVAGFFSYIHWKFLLLLVTGIGLAVVFFTRIVPLQIYMFTHPELIYGLFFGLIVGSIVLLILEIDPSKRTWGISLPLLAGVLIGFWVVTLVPADTPESFWFVFLAGSVAIIAMILPGISGSYLLLIFRKYDYILTQVAGIGGSETTAALLNLLPFALGAAAGLIVFSRVLSWLLKNYHTKTLALLIGFMVGSLYVIWPFQEREFQESPRGSEIYSYQDPRVQDIINRDGIPDLPRYEIAGDVLNPDDAEQNWQVEVTEISRKLVSSKPVMPGGRNSGNFNIAQAAAGMVFGAVLIGFISFLRRKGKPSNNK